MENTNKIVKIFVSVFLCIVILCIGFFAGMYFERSAGSKADVVLPYDGDISDADVFIDMPNLRQYGGYTCGTTCVQMIMNFMLPYDGDINLADLETELGSSEEAGTTPDSILSYFNKMGINVYSEEKISISDLIAALDNKSPVMMPIQAWSAAEDGSYNLSDPSDTETYLSEGHYVICVGYKNTSEGYIFYFNDPACTGYCLLKEAELDERWIDVDANGRIYDHFGIVVNAGDVSYSPSGAYHLD